MKFIHFKTAGVQNLNVTKRSFSFASVLLTGDTLAAFSATAQKPNFNIVLADDGCWDGSVPHSRRAV